VDRWQQACLSYADAGVVTASAIKGKLASDYMTAAASSLSGCHCSGSTAVFCRRNSTMPVKPVACPCIHSAKVQWMVLIVFRTFTKIHSSAAASCPAYSWVHETSEHLKTCHPSSRQRPYTPKTLALSCKKIAIRYSRLSSFPVHKMSASFPEPGAL